MGTVTRTSPQRIKFEAAIEGLDEFETRVGWFESAVYPDGTPVAYVATIQEFGAPSQAIPARPFMRPTIVAEQKNWAERMRKDSKKVAKGELTPWAAFERLGLLAAGDVRNTISTITEPKLSDLTLAVRAYLKDVKGTPLGRLSGAKELKTVEGLLAKGKLDLSGVSQKPLVFSSVLLSTLSHTVTRK